jgi:diaminopimelate decarboxylase
LIETKSVLLKAEEILGRETLVLEDEVLSAYVLSFLEKRDAFMDCCQRHETPLHVFDRRALLDRARKFTAAFEEEIPGFRAFFAMKSNNLPAVSRCLVEFGLGLDVSSGRELDVALGAGCKDILFSGPGKTTAELEKAVHSRDRVTLLLDSFGELERLEQVAAPRGGAVRAGVRLTTEEEGLWRKFGIRLADLDRFLDKAESSEHVNLCGLQFHTSWNLDPGAQVAFLHRLGEQIGSLNQDRRKALEFLDIGGGFWSPLGEWVHFPGTPEGRLVQSVLPHIRPQEHYRLPSQSIDSFARRIAQGLRKCIFPHVKCRVLAEPGRWLADDSMHILLRVVDKKADDLVVTDGGTNIVGWERFETDYCPVINLSRPSLTERNCMIFGSLCTPHDIWGYGYFGEGIEPGDVLMIPSQGAYTFSLRQQFIKPLAKVVSLEAPDLVMEVFGQDRKGMSP